MPPQEYSGTLRPKITILSLEFAKMEWISPTGDVIWTEHIRPKVGMSFVSQIECNGDFSVRGGYFVDQEGKRHFVLPAEPGALGVLMGR